METTTVFVSIGRNERSDPMPAQWWERFQQTVDRVLHAYGATVLGRYSGQGEWEGETEESAGWLVSFPTGDAHKLSGVRNRLHDVGADFNQDGVGFTVHGANPWPESFTS